MQCDGHAYSAAGLGPVDDVWNLGGKAIFPDLEPLRASRRRKVSIVQKVVLGISLGHLYWTTSSHGHVNII